MRFSDGKTVIGSISTFEILKKGVNCLLMLTRRTIYNKLVRKIYN